MRIGLVLPSLGAGGAEQVVLGLARECMALGHEVAVICMDGGGDMRERFVGSGVRLRELGLKREFRLSPGWVAEVMHARAEVGRCLLGEGLDVVHTHLVGADAGFLRAARGAGVGALVHTIHNAYKQYASRRPVDRLRNRRAKAAFRGYDRVFAVDDEVRSWAVETGMVDGGGIETVSNGIMLSSLDVREARGELRKRYGMGDSEKIVLNIGSLTPQKNQTTLIRAFHMLARKGGGARLLIAGEGPLRGALESEAASLGMGGAVRLLGYRDDVPALLKAADLFAFPSLWEGLPIALLEALACGTAALASDIPVHRRILADGRFGRLAPADSPAGLAVELEKALDASRPGNAVKEAREMVVENYSAARMAKDYIRRYREVLDGVEADTEPGP